jgi:chromosome partitioning protein
MAAEPKRFIELFNHPTVEAMYALSPSEFEHFVAYVLRRAGYDVRPVGLRWLRGVDLEMRQPGYSRIVGGVECKRYQPGDLVPASVVSHLLGAAAVSRPGAKPYVVTTSDFHENAHKVAEAGAKQAHLMNGSQLVRYITYIRGSRHDDENTITSLSPEFFAGQDSTKHSVSGANILTVANNKGGVGKTTTAYYLGVEIARQGKRVLLIDLDGQANLTERCIPAQLEKLSEDSGLAAGIVQYFAGEQPLINLIIPSEAPGVSLIPSDPFLRLRDLGGSGRPDVEWQFVRDVHKLGSQQIATLGGSPDWIIIDTPPAMSVFTRAALAAAHYVVAPIRPRRASLAGTRNMLLTLRTMDALTDTNGRFLGTVMTHWDNLGISKRFAEIDLPRALQGSLREFGGQAFQATIPVDNQLETLEPGAKTGGATAYKALTAEVLATVKRRSASRSGQKEAVSNVVALREG